MVQHRRKTWYGMEYNIKCSIESLEVWVRLGLGLESLFFMLHSILCFYIPFHSVPGFRLPFKYLFLRTVKTIHGTGS